MARLTPEERDLIIIRLLEVWGSRLHPHTVPAVRVQLQKCSDLGLLRVAMDTATESEMRS